MKVDPNRVHAFANSAAFEAWLREHSTRETEVWIKIHKVRSGLPSITPAEAIDVALCWGWIDAIRKSLDAQSFLQRYTPRGKKSVWSQVNVANVARLVAEGRMQPAGLAQVEAAKADGRWDRAYRQSTTEPPPEFLAAIAASPRAQATYARLSSQNRFAFAFRLLALKTEAARARKIEAFVAMLEQGKTFHPSAPSPRARGGG